MDKEEIRTAFIKKVNEFPKADTNPTGLRGKIDHWKTRLTDSSLLMEKMVDMLNDTLREENIDLNETEKSELLSYLKPTMLNLIGDYIKK